MVRRTKRESCNGTLWMTLINSPEGTGLGTGCDAPPLVVKRLDNTSILQGTNHTFLCEGNGSFIEWNIDSEPVYKLDHPKLKLPPFPDSAYDDSCEPESSLTVHAKSSPEDHSLSTFAVQCVVRIKDIDAVAISEAYLTVHVIGGAGDVELVSPASPGGPAIIQWNAPDVLTGSSSPLYYNITVRDPSNQVITQNTTTDTFLAIDSDLLVPCHSYELTLLPFQHISNHIELGIMTQTAKDYSGTPLPASDVKFSVSLEHDAPSLTITFKVNFTSCSLQRPESYTVTVLKQGTNISETFQSAEQTVMDVENEYTVENLDFRQKYLLSIKLERSSSSSIPVTANISTFTVQNLTLMEQEGGCELDVHCDMAKGAEDKNCNVMMISETGDLLQNCFPSGVRDATCKLSRLALGKYMIQGYDWEGEETPAVEHVFFFTKNSSDCLTNTPTTRTVDTTTLESSPSKFEDEEAVQIDLIIGIVAPLIILVLIAGLFSIIVAVVKLRRSKQNYHLDVPDTEAACTVEHVYPKAEKNKYDEHSILQQQDTPTEPTPVQEPAYAEVQTPIEGNGYNEHGLSWKQSAVTEPIVVQEPACADARTVISTTDTTNDSPNQ